MRTLVTIINEIAAGKSYDTLATKFRLFGKRKNVLRNASRQISVTELERLLRLCGDADQAVKGQLQTDPWLLISQISLGLAGIQVPSSQSA